MTLQEVIKRDLDGLKQKSPPSSLVRVLIVEDNEFEAEVLEDKLHSKGAQTQVVKTADDAIQSILAAIPFAAAIIDLSLSGAKSGIAVAAALKQFWPKTKIVIISGFVTQEITSVCQSHGFSVFQKPIDSLALSGIIDTVLNNP